MVIYIFLFIETLQLILCKLQKNDHFPVIQMNLQELRLVVSETSQFATSWAFPAELGKTTRMYEHYQMLE